MTENLFSSSSEPSEKRGPSRRTIIKGAAWSVPVIAAAVAAPAASASTEPTRVWDLAYIAGPTTNTSAVNPGNTPHTDFTFNSVGPDAAVLALIQIRIPSAYNDVERTNALISAGQATTPGWILQNTYPDGPYDVYAFMQRDMPVGTHVFRFFHAVEGAPGGSYQIGMNLVTLQGETTHANNGGWQNSGVIRVV